MAQKTVIMIAGPTAVGKTAVGIAVARHFGTEIISADSRQCYRELSIGVARPSADELTAVPHHFIASHSIQEPVTAATFEAYALDHAAALFERHDTVVMVGGTGLYLTAFAEGLDEIPAIPADLRLSTRMQYETRGLGWLQEEVRAADPLYFSRGEIQNPHRLLRALEVVRATGRSIVSFRTERSAERPFRIARIALELPRPLLYERINARVDAMMESGLLAEVEGLQQQRHLPALRTVGYSELFDHLDGTVTLAEAVERIKTNTRRYAKRQLTWFRKDDAFTWLAPDDESAIIAAAERDVRRPAD
ncbi:MAG: miaA [Flaviaesturariibacter sp.]|nr:miaA [Flaviaesturariibacter sp.]